ncbi:aldo/keto reductase [Agilicoccus flavus]|uniref:aldo/keto reductase n=1 Tax=Agilicoccus flavus TaxID=2775968 RepID=UPI001CF6443B|nr:aldo/keto reductase [Agilicoccus flavus]
MTTSPTLTFHDGHTIPQLGYGVWQVEDDVAEKVVGLALDAGYRHIDTAAVYGNEAGVGRALKNNDVAREDVFVTTKLWNSEQGYDSTLKAFDASMAKLGIDTLDMYLIHWAMPREKTYVDTWKAFVELQKQGRVTSIGVSNFPEEQLEHLISETGVVPVMHQIELSPYLTQERLREVDAKHDILTQAWSPLGSGKGLLDDATLAKIAQKHGATPAQVVLAWHLAIGNVVIPKSVTPERIVENYGALDVTLDDEDVAAISGLDRGERTGPDPAEFHHKG